jgi:hypothetical protein
MGKAKVHFKTDTERGPLEFRVEMPDSHPIVASLITYAVEMARPDRSQLPLFEERPCKVKDCDNPAGDETGLCLAHEPHEDDPPDEPRPEAEDIPPHCSVEGCHLPGTKKTGMCRAHNKANREGKALEAARESAPRAAAAAEKGGSGLVCDARGCDELAAMDSVYCTAHADLDRLCRIDGCSEPAEVLGGLCLKHECSTVGCTNIANPTGLCDVCQHRAPDDAA